MTLHATTASPVIRFDFDAAFERKVAALVVRDFRFLKETLDYLDPVYFTDALDSNIVRIAQNFARKYNTRAEIKTIMGLVKDRKDIKTIEHTLYGKRLIEIRHIDLAERPYIRERVLDFCRRQAYLLLAADIPDLLDKEKVNIIEKRHKKIATIGEDTTSQRYDYFKETSSRLDFREKVATGEIVRGVSTGIPDIDKYLYHGGYERGGLTAFMAPAKRAKTALMLQSALVGCHAEGNNTLFVSLEVGRDIVVDRLDAALTSTKMDDLITNRELVKKASEKIATDPDRGNLFIECFPSNTLTINKLELLVNSYLDDGIDLDNVFVDYIGIMRMHNPNDRYISLGNTAKDMRRIAGEHDIAMITAAQTNRGAVNAEVARMDSIGESFAIVQDVDLLISINANDAELNAGVRRIHWAASRNQAERTITVKGNLELMQVIQSVIGVSS